MMGFIFTPVRVNVAYMVTLNAYKALWLWRTKNAVSAQCTISNHRKTVTDKLLSEQKFVTISTLSNVLHRSYFHE